MRYYYKNKNSDFYQPNPLDNPLTWIAGSASVIGITYYLWFKGYQSEFLSYVADLALTILISLIIHECIQAKRHLGKVSRLSSYALNCFKVQAITTSILNSRSKASMTNKSYCVLPKIWAYRNGKYLVFKVEKLAGTYSDDIDKIAELISSSLGDRLRVKDEWEEDNGSWFDFIVEPVEGSPVFVPAVKDLISQPPYKVRLMRGTAGVWDFSKNPHLAVYGKTQSGKSTLLWSIVAQVIGNSNLYFVDFKREYISLEKFMPSEIFATDPDKITVVFEKLVRELEERKKIVEEKAKKSDATSLTGYDVGLRPTYLIVDEWASVLAAFGSSTEGKKKRKKCEDLFLQILMQGRAYSMYVLYSSQSPATEVLSSQMRSQFGTYILLGSASSDVQRMALGQVATTGSTPPYTGYYLRSTADMHQPEKFYVPNLLIHRINRVSVYQKLKEEGNKNEALEKTKH